MAKIKVLGGNISPGDWDFHQGRMISCLTRGFSQEEPLNGRVVSVEKLDEEKVRSLPAKAGWAFVGSTLAGPLGMVAGAIFGGNGKQVCFAVELADGRFLATSDKTTFAAFAGLAQSASPVAAE